MEIDDEECTCGICCNTFDQCEYLPRILPCSHVVCSNCLEEIEKIDDIILCPYCRGEYVEPVEDLPIKDTFTRSNQTPAGNDR